MSLAFGDGLGFRKVESNMAGGSRTDPAPLYDPSLSPSFHCLVYDPSNSQNEYWTATDFTDKSTWTRQATAVGDIGNPQGYLGEHNGTHYAISNNGDQVEIYSGSFIDQLTSTGIVVGDKDAGGWIEDDGTTYIVGESASTNPTSDTASEAVASSPEGSYSVTDPVIDVSGKPWGSGDWESVEINGTRYLWGDNYDGTYKTARWRFEGQGQYVLETDVCGFGADMTPFVADRGDGPELWALSEFGIALHAEAKVLAAGTGLSGQIVSDSTDVA